MARNAAFALIGAALLLLAGGAWFFSGCDAIPHEPNATGSHGFRVWEGPSLISFDHGLRAVCIPEGWQPVGAVSSGNGRATFQSGMTGVFIRPGAFTSTAMSFTNSSYAVTLLYPAAIDPALLATFKAAIANAFERTGLEFGDSANNPPRPHTVFITAGLGSSDRESDAIYPDPGPNVSYFIMPPYTIRGEELFIHAVSHLYNRHQTDAAHLAYQSKQKPYPPESWQELEATWAETAFRTSDTGRRSRLGYLYGVHIAVQTDNFSLIEEPPFNDEAAFKAIRHTTLLSSNPTFLDDQYASYVLMPLATVATEGMLQTYKTGTDLETIFTSLHTTQSENYFDELAKYLPADAMSEIKGWYFDGKTIPQDMVFAGADYYAKRGAQ